MPLYTHLAIQFGLLLSLALRFGFFMLVASYSIDSDTNREVLSELHNFNDLVGIVVLTVMLVFVAVVVDRLVKYRIRLHCLRQWWENLARTIRCVVISILLVISVVGVVVVIYDDISINGSTTNDCYDDSSQSYMYFTVVFLLTNIGSIGAIVGVAIMSDEVVLKELFITRNKLLFMLSTILVCYITNFLLVVELPYKGDQPANSSEALAWPHRPALSPCIFYNPADETSTQTVALAMVYYGLEIVYFAVVSALMMNWGNTQELLVLLETRNNNTANRGQASSSMMSSMGSRPEQLASNARLLYHAMKEDKARARDNWIIRPTNVTKQRKLFSGGEAQIFVGNYFGSRVALKEILASYMYNDIEGLVREAKLLKQIKHPNVVTFFGICIDQERYFLVEEYLPRTLVDLLRDVRAAKQQRQMTIFIRLSAAVQLCSALQYLHSLRILHLDVKPDNILISENQIRLCDFGFSRRLDKDGSVTVSSAHGTPGYAAPELSQNPVHAASRTETVRITTAADVFSFGMLLWQLFADSNVETALLGPIDELQSVVESSPPVLPPITAAAREAMQSFVQTPKSERESERKSLIAKAPSSPEPTLYTSYGSVEEDCDEISLELSSPSSGVTRLLAEAAKSPRYISLNRVEQGLRPRVSSWCPVCIQGIIQSCWHQDPARRPAFSAVSTRLADAANQLNAPDLNDVMLTVPTSTPAKTTVRARRAPATTAAQDRSGKMFTKNNRRRTFSNSV